LSTLNINRYYQQHVLHYYNRFSHLYDLGEFIRRGTRHKAMLLSGWQPGENVLDLCTGTGDLAITLALQGASVIGIDIARGMLKRAYAKSKNLTAAWLQMDATGLAFADNSFQISMLSLALHHMPIQTQLQVLMELRRVTSRCIVIIEPDIPVKPQWIPIWKFVASVIDESEHMHEWVYQDFAATCRAAGLKVESIHSSTLGLHRIVICNPRIGDPKMETDSIESR
jgi:ubiquinone/menaquinone biosynthesis C-methylase UbiE